MRNLGINLRRGDVLTRSGRKMSLHEIVMNFSSHSRTHLRYLQSSFTESFERASGGVNREKYERRSRSERKYPTSERELQVGYYFSLIVIH